MPLDKWKNLTTKKKIICAVLICIVILFMYLVACSISETNQKNQLDKLKLPDGFDQKYFSHFGSNTPLYLSADGYEVQGYSLRVQFGDELSDDFTKFPKNSTFYQTRNGLGEVVEIDGEVYTVRVSKPVGYDFDSAKYCRDALIDFNELNNATFVDG